MNYRPIITPQGERLWLPILAGAAIITAPFWLGRGCCGNNQNYQNYQPYPYQQPYYPQVYPYPVPYPVYYQPASTDINNIIY